MTTELYNRVPGDDTFDTFRRKLNGKSPARFDEIVAWTQVVEDITVFPAPSDLERMMPPTAV